MKQKKAHASHTLGNRTVIGIICIVVALAICFGIAPLVNRLSDGKTKIVRLTRDISAGATITEADIEVADVGSYNLPTGVIKDKAQVVGKCALSSLSKGDYLFPSKIGNDTNNAGRMLESLDEKHKAISITIGSFALGFSGKLETGDIVGILVYDQVENRSYTPKELTYVKVITTTTSSGVDKADVEDKSQPVTVTLLVNNEQAELLTLNKLILETRQMFLSREESDDFLAKVALQGYEYNNYYDDFVFEISNVMRYAVGKEFPKLTSANVPKAIAKASYDISLSEIQSFIINK